MLKRRVIPCVLLSNWQLTKSIRFREFRTIGHPKVTAKIYNTRAVDELIVLDIMASPNCREPDYATLQQIADECYMPLTLGGGIKSVEQVDRLLEIGADKVSINSALLSDSNLVEQIVSKYGSQVLVGSVDVLRVGGLYKVAANANQASNLDVREHIKNIQDQGVGEILLTSVDNDGMQIGYDLELLSSVVSVASVPLIINGGAGAPNHFLDAAKLGADAFAAASIFHFSQHTPQDVKRHLFENDIPVRLL